MSALDVGLQELKQCQEKHNYPSCVFCEQNNKCSMQDQFVSLVQDNLKAQTQEVQQCQKNHNLTTCTQCEQHLECELRNAYVSVVYLSMNKGNGGNFDF